MLAHSPDTAEAAMAKGKRVKKSLENCIVVNVFGGFQSREA